MHQKKCNPAVDEEGNKENVNLADDDNVDKESSFTDPETSFCSYSFVDPRKTVYQKIDDDTAEKRLS